MAIKYLKSAKIKNKTVLVRGSVDAPVNDEGEVSDDFRLRSTLPTIKFLWENGNGVIICGKRKRAKGKIVPEYTLESAAKYLAGLMDMKFTGEDKPIANVSSGKFIFYSGDFTQDKHAKFIKQAAKENVVFLENLEFYQQELDDNPMFAKKLASLAEIFVEDDFSKCHRKVASTVGVTKYLPSYAGLLLEQEIKSLDAVVKNVKHPFLIMTGGVKLTEKVGTLQNLGKKADTILVGGGVANLMFQTKGYEIGLSKIEEGQSKTAWEITKNYKDKLRLPVDVVVANKDMDKNSIRACQPHEVKSYEMILDAGPKTILAYAKEIKKAKTILWSGPLGLFEKSPFHHATMALARLIGGRGKGKAFVVAGGGDTVDAIHQSHQAEHIDHVSTGGGAMLEYLAGKKLPGVEALK